MKSTKAKSKISQAASLLARRGGLARAAKYSKAQLSIWGKAGGRPVTKKQNENKK